MPSLEHPSRFSWRSLLIVHLIALVGLFALVLSETRPVAMHDLHLAEGEKLKCVSYAPYRLPGQTPFDPNLRIDIEQIRSDLTELSRITECVRLYSVDQGLEQVPTVAREVGLKVLLGAWISANPKDSQKELDRALAIANAHPDVVKMLIVGNEVLLRRERTLAQMQGLIEYAQARTEIPVTYADVWEFWVENAELADAVDVVTVHILPFWENDPVGVDTAIEHVVATVEEVRHVFGARHILIGETGWPSAGRQREASRPSVVNQARYIREFVHQAHANGWDYNLIEAIDQPWKRRLEGTVGGFWGFLDTELRPKFPLAGPVTERASAMPALVAALTGALLLLAVGARGRASSGDARQRYAALTAMGLTLGVTALLQWEHALLAYRNALEWGLLGLLSLLALSVPILVAARPTAHIPGASLAWAEMRSAGRVELHAWSLATLRLTLLFAAAVGALLLFMDPRYRDFPTLLYLAPALCFAPLARMAHSRAGLEERLCAWVIAGCVVARWIYEPLNPQAGAWMVVGLLLAAPFLGKLPADHKQ